MKSASATGSSRRFPRRLAALFLVASPASPVQSASISFAPRSRIPVWNSPAPDFQALFDPGAPWQAAASHVAVFNLYLSRRVTAQFRGTALETGFIPGISAG